LAHLHLITPPAFDPPLGGSPLEYCQDVWYGKLEWFGYPMVKNLKIRLLILTECMHVTDERTDRWTLHDGTGCTCTASCRKNWSKILTSALSCHAKETKFNGRQTNKCLINKSQASCGASTTNHTPLTHQQHFINIR